LNSKHAFTQLIDPDTFTFLLLAKVHDQSIFNTTRHNTSQSFGVYNYNMYLLTFIQ